MALRFLAGGGVAGDTPADALRVRDSERLRRYREYLAFYEGRHWVRPRNGRSALVLNYAKAVVDKGVSYLLGRGIGYAVPAELGYAGGEAAESAERYLYEAHDANEMELVDLSVALNSALLGDGVYKVVWDAAERRPRVVSVDPLSFFPRWSGDDLGADRWGRRGLDDVLLMPRKLAAEAMAAALP